MPEKPKQSLWTTDPSEQFAEFQKLMMAPFGAGGNAWAESCQKYFDEMSKFMTMRFEKDIETQKRLLACRDIEELRAVQAKFLEEAMADYQEETARLMEIGRNFLDAATKLPSTKP